VPIVIRTNDVRTRDMAQQAIAAIVDANDPPTLFARAEDNLQITRWGERIQPMDKALATHLGEEFCDWVTVRKTGAVATRMPPHVADDMLARAPWADLPPLKRLVRSPIILPDARILGSSGYDASTGLYLALEPGFSLPTVPDEPTEDDLHGAFAYVRSFLDEFVFGSEADAANAVGLFIGHLLRPLIGDEALLPMFCVDAPTQSTGKTALANATGVLALGGPPKIVPEIKDADEWRKQVAALLVGETELVLFDNLTHKLDDASLAAMLTGEGMWGGRLLGGNLMVNERTKLTVIVTGNNLQVGDDLRRRVIYIRLNTNMPDPSSRMFRRTDFLGSLKQARPRLLAAFFTWARRWLQLGSPVSNAPILAGYNAFVRTVHGMLSMLGVDQWLGNLASFRDAQDPETAVWALWLGEWYALWGSEPQKSVDLAAALNSGSPPYEAFSVARPSAFETYTQIDRDKLKTTIGNLLPTRVDQFFGNYQLLKATLKNGIQRWRVVPLDPSQTGSRGPRVTVTPQPQGHPGSESVALVEQVALVSSPPAGNKTKNSHTRVGKETSSTSSTSSTKNDATTRAGARRDTRPSRVYSPSGPIGFAAVLRARALPGEKDMKGLDTETTGLRWWKPGERLRLVTLAAEEGSDLLDLDALRGQQYEDLVGLLDDPNGPELTMHNAVFDLAMMHAAGYPLPSMHRVFDTMLASQLLDQSGDTRPPQSLEALAERYLGVSLDKTYQLSDWTGDLSPEQLNYARGDAEVTLKLARVLKERIRKEGLEEALRIEHEFIPFMIALAGNGLPVDQVAWASLEQHAIEQRLRLEADLARLYPGTPPERWTAKGWLEAYLEERGLVTERTSQGKPSLSKTALENAQHDPLVAAYTAWKPYEKRGSTWGTRFLLDNLSEHDGRFHGDYRQLGTRTGRLSCDKPNLQNIPRGGYREALRPSPGRCFVKADYSQLQLVIIADETRDRVMLSAYDPKVPHKDRPDLHTITARSVLGMHIPEGQRVKGAHRVVAKGINFGLCYGMGAGRLAAMIERETGEPCDLEVAKMRKYRYFQTYDGVKAWHERPEHKSARGLSYDDLEHPNPIDVRSPSGRRRSQVVDFSQKVNSPIQMREADGVKAGLALLLPKLERFNDARPVMMIHDEVLVECDKAEARAVGLVVAGSLEEGMNRWLKYTTATVEVEIVQDYAGTPL
jgi:DNA polymerase I